jgi:hypothetical protein
VALDEALLRRLRRQLLVETDVGSLDGFAMISNWEQYDRYTEISLPFRRFNDMRLELGAQQVGRSAGSGFPTEPRRY